MMGEFFLIKRKINYLVKSTLKAKSDKILDLGCGNDPYYHDAVQCNIVCLDIIPTLKTHLVSDAGKLPFRPNSFDKVISVNSLYYFDDPVNAVKSVHGTLKKNGKFILVLPFFYPIHDVPDDKYRFTEHGLRTILGSYFKIESLEPIGGIFNLPAVLLHSVIKGIPLLVPKPIKGFVQTLMYVLWPFYMAAQLLGVLDILDRTKRYPTYYFVVAGKK